jgi:hypothetical protein
VSDEPQLAESMGMMLRKEGHHERILERAMTGNDTNTNPPYELSAVEDHLYPAELMSNARHEK